MKHHYVYRGGDAKIPFSRHHATTGLVGNEVRYAGHLPRRNFVLDFYFDANSREWVGYAEQEGKIEPGDKIHAILISGSTLITGLVFFNKRDATVGEGADAKVPQIMVNIEGSSNSGPTFSLDTVGASHINLSSYMQPSALFTAYDKPTTVTITVSPGAPLDNACFSLMVEVVDYHDERLCSCAVAPCETEYPDPDCNGYENLTSASTTRVEPQRRMATDEEGEETPAKRGGKK